MMFGVESTQRWVHVGWLRSVLVGRCGGAARGLETHARCDAGARRLQRLRQHVGGSSIQRGHGRQALDY